MASIMSISCLYIYIYIKGKITSFLQGSNFHSQKTPNSLKSMIILSLKVSEFLELLNLPLKLSIIHDLITPYITFDYS